MTYKLVDRKMLDFRSWNSGYWKILIPLTLLGHVFVDLLPIAGSDFLEVVWVCFHGGFFRFVG